MHKILWLTPEQLRIYCAHNHRSTICGKPGCSREDEILIARLVSLGVAVGLSSVAGLGLSSPSTVHAAQSVWSAHAAPTKRPQFRPWSRSTRVSVSTRWRPHADTRARTVNPATATRTAGSSTGRRVRQLPFVLDRHASPDSSRSTPRVFGGQFRPQRRGSDRLTPASGGSRPQPGGYSAMLQAQFRPTRTQRRPSYEELQAGKDPTRGAVYPVGSTYGAMRYAGHWPGW